MGLKSKFIKHIFEDAADLQTKPQSQNHTPAPNVLPFCWDEKDFLNFRFNLLRSCPLILDWSFVQEALTLNPPSVTANALRLAFLIIL